MLVWNRELLYVGGFLSRAVYEQELSKVESMWEGTAESSGTPGPDFGPSTVLQDAAHKRFLHIIKFFTFHRSTPSEKVAKLLGDAFYRCSTAPLRLLSSAGIRLSPEIKEYDPAVVTFLKYLPILPEYVAQECSKFVEDLPDGHKILPPTVSDILQDLEDRALTQEEFADCISWWTSRKDTLEDETARLLNVITICRTNGSPLQLSSVTHFIGPESLTARIPLDGPLPVSLMPYDISAALTRRVLTSLGWQEFTILDWFRHISQPGIMSDDPDHDFTRSEQWAQRVLSVLSGVWSAQSDKLHSVVASVFKGQSCIPTTCGLRPPEESFLPRPDIPLFRYLDLPTVRFTVKPKNKGEMEGFLSSIGIRKHVPLEVVLDR